MTIRVTVTYAEQYYEVLTFDERTKPTVADIIRRVGFVALVSEKDYVLYCDVDLPLMGLNNARFVALEWTQPMMSCYCAVAERYLGVVMADLSQLVDGRA